jgi:hypothetical protein
LIWWGGGDVNVEVRGIPPLRQKQVRRKDGAPGTRRGLGGPMRFVGSHPFAEERERMGHGSFVEGQDQETELLDLNGYCGLGGGGA